ncbi:Uncharacterised protein [Chryseobacterium gleum]|uniref:Uncharacterized protein n=2 Tax=Chryseobacterium gleum TaxID=250 RepID=A0A448B608_CHRGE|nr:hypothetical protein [Chryseobacterium gleum]EFK37728.1 hypothetical protein HMPREF0204_10501 [Chryseobacterium gleum ATCC 35910]QQY32793.1 hypothetical protein I6I60_03120 [Chryseobacterium gleum]VEE09969.1 Uncharacterised protein [Chryseobacterium gleum]
MESKTFKISYLLDELSREDFYGYKLVDYWDADTEALGLQKGNVVIYISTFDFSQTGHYDIIIEESETSKILKEGQYIIY